MADQTTPLPPVIFVQPEIIAALDRIATAFEQTATALAGRPPVDDVAHVAPGVPRTFAQLAAAQRTAACTAEIWSEEHFLGPDLAPYWIRCTERGQHTTHKNSSTGATWQEED